MGCPYIVRSVIRHSDLDTLCTSFDCYRNTTSFAFYRIILYVISLLVCILAEAQAMMSLHQNNLLKKKNNLSNLNPIFSIFFKLGRLIYPELVFRILVISLYVNVIISFVCYIL